jgi:hypothetical protein
MGRGKVWSRSFNTASIRRTKESRTRAFADPRPSVSALHSPVGAEPSRRPQGVRTTPLHLVDIAPYSAEFTNCAEASERSKV